MENDINQTILGCLNYRRITLQEQFESINIEIELKRELFEEIANDEIINETASHMLKNLDVEIETLELTLNKARIALASVDKAIVYVLTNKDKLTNITDLKELAIEPNTIEEAIITIIDDLNKFTKTSDITAIALKRYPKFNNPTQDFSRKITLSLDRLKGKNILTNKKIDKSNKYAYWGKNMWLDNKGNINPDFMFDKTIVVK